MRLRSERSRCRKPAWNKSANGWLNRLNVDLNRVYVLLRLGRVARRKIDGQWWVSSRAVEQRLRDSTAAEVRS